MARPPADGQQALYQDRRARRFLERSLAGAASSLLADLIVKTSAAARLRYPVPTADRLLQAAGLLL